MKKKAKPKYEIIKCLVLSTAHMTSNDDDKCKELCAKLNLCGENVILDSHDFGWTLTWDSLKEMSKSIEASGLSHALYKVLVFAGKLGCNSVKFDADAPVYDELVVFDW